MARELLEGVPILVHRVHAQAGYQGKPFVAQVADAWVCDAGRDKRPKRFTTPAQALTAAREEAARLRALRLLLVCAWG